MEELDVVIVGAGPAGLSAGIVLAQHGLQTLIIEKKILPVDKACGEGVMPAGVSHLRRLGVHQYLEPGEIFRFRGIRYISPDGDVAVGTFRDGPGWGIRRTTLSRVLAQCARDIPSLRVLEGCSAVPLEEDNGQIVVGVGEKKFATRLLIGADGLNSRVRSWAGLEGPPSKLMRWGARQHFHLKPWTDFVEVHWKAGLEAYVTPIGVDQLGIAFLWDRSFHPTMAGGKELIPSLLAFFPSLQECLEGSSPIGSPQAVGPMHRRVSSPVADGTILIGDAAGYLDAITGEGLSLAFGQALTLEETIVPLVLRARQTGRKISSQDLRSYAKATYRINLPYERFTRLILFLSRRPLLAVRAIKFLSRQPKLFQHLLTLSMGVAP